MSLAVDVIKTAKKQIKFWRTTTIILAVVLAVEIISKINF